MARVLLVDPDAVARQHYRRSLTNEGHEVEDVDTGQDALRLLAEAPFDIVVTELTLPDISGIELVRAARQSVTGAAEVIVVTSVERVEPALEAIRAGAAEYLSRPVHAASLAHVIERTLAMRTLADTNELLRQYVALADAARRIATARDREQLFSSAYASIPQLSGAESVLIYTRTEDRCTLQPGHSFDPKNLNRVAKYFAGELRSIETLDGPREIDSPMEGRRAFVYPARDSGSLRAFVVSFYDRGPEETEHSATAYLARNLALGFEHLERAIAGKELAFRDHLTSLFNTRYLQQALETQMATALQRKQPFSVLFLDVDHFKQVNDTHGHAVGSLALVEMARLLRQCVRESDTIVRYGGDEFVVLLPKSDAGGAVQVAERIRRRVKEHSFLAREGRNLQLTACIGVASYPEHAANTDELLEQADDAMYHGKRGNRGLVSVAAPKTGPTQLTS